MATVNSRAPSLTANHTVDTTADDFDHEFDQIPIVRERRMSRLEMVKDVSEEILLLTRLAAQLAWALRVSKLWIIMLIRLILFVVFLLPAFIQVLWYWLFSKDVIKNIRYGPKNRNLLDIYRVHRKDNHGQKLPVIVFLTGGAWIIGYKAWGGLMGKVISHFGVILVTPDYRNFPQGIISDMIDDTSLALAWVFQNIHHFGGDPDNITLMGQSAGAHIGACTLIEKCIGGDTSETPNWCPSRLRGFIGISGPYDIGQAIEDFHQRGLDKSITRRIMGNQIARYSPTSRLLDSGICEKPEILSRFPPITLFHGTADITVSWECTEKFADALDHLKITCVKYYYANKSHTDPILEDPITGDDPLLRDVMSVIRNATPPSSPKPQPGTEKFVPAARMCPEILIRLARYVNPF